MSFVDGVEAGTIHGQDPQNLIEKIIRSRIHESVYWKEHCFALSAETIVDKAIDLKSIGGQFGMQKPTEFLCLTMRLLQLQPEKSIIAVYLQNEDHKYLTALAAFYIRLTFKSVDCYKYLEPLLLDKRKLRMRDAQGNYYLSYMDEFADTLLRSDRVCEIILPRITKRSVLVEAKDLEERISPLEEDFMDEDEVEEDGDKEKEEGAMEMDSEKGDVETRATSGNETGQSTTRKSEITSTKEEGETIESKPLIKENDTPTSQRNQSRPHSRGEELSSNRYGRESDRATRNKSRDRSRDRGDRYSRRDSRERRPYYDRDGSLDRRDRDRDRRDDSHYRSDRRREYDDDDRDYRRRDVDRADRGREDNQRDSRPVGEEIGEPFEPPLSSADDLEKKKKKYSSKKVNALFKKSGKSGDSKDSSSGGGGDETAGGGSRESMSIEETNKMRISLGLKPLKQ